MLTGKEICFYGRSATKVDDAEGYFMSGLRTMKEPEQLAMPDNDDIYFDNGVSGNERHRDALDSMMEKIYTGAYDVVVVPAMKDLAADMRVMVDIVKEVYEAGASVYCMDTNAEVNILKLALFALFSETSEHRIKAGLRGSRRRARDNSWCYGER